MPRLLPITARLPARVARAALLALVCACATAWTGPADAAGGANAVAGAAEHEVLLHEEGSVFDETTRGFLAAHPDTPEFVVGPEAREADAAAVLFARVRAASPTIVVTVGPDAARFAEQYLASTPRVVALDPGGAAASADANPGAPAATPVVRLESEIPPAVQMRWIASTLPDVRSIGVVFDPSASQKLVDQLSSAATAVSTHRRRVSIVPIAVTSERDVPGAFRRKLPSIEALLFIPDPTVINDDTMKYLLKESVDAEIPAIGFNSQYFIQNGAVLSLEPDYAALGRQAADAAAKLASDHAAAIAPPQRIDVWVNTIVASKLRLRLDYDQDKVKEFRR